MSLGIGTQGDGLCALKSRRVGSAIRGMSGSHGGTAFPAELVFGAWPHRRASLGNAGIRRAMDRTIARTLQCRGARGAW
jgi:hypothetical protein